MGGSEFRFAGTTEHFTGPPPSGSIRTSRRQHYGAFDRTSPEREDPSIVLSVLRCLSLDLPRVGGSGHHDVVSTTVPLSGLPPSGKIRASLRQHSGALLSDLPRVGGSGPFVSTQDRDNNFSRTSQHRKHVSSSQVRHNIADNNISTFSNVSNLSNLSSHHR